MKFLIDAQLPPALARLLRQAGHAVVHTLELPLANLTPDADLLRVCRDDQRVLVTKDYDFLDFFLLRREPSKLLLVTTGNIANPTLLQLFEMNLANICELFANNSVVELSRNTLIVHF